MSKKSDTRLGSYEVHQEIVKEILVFLSTHRRIRAWQNQTGVGKSLTGSRVIRYGLVGSSDILGILGPFGKLLCIEVKSGKVKQSVEQCTFQRMVTDLGAVYILASSVLDVETTLRRLGYIE